MKTNGKCRFGKLQVIILILVLPVMANAYPRPPGEWTGWLVLDPWGSMYFYNQCYIFPVHQQIVPELMSHAGKPCILDVQKTYSLLTPGPVRIEKAVYVRPPVFGELKALSLHAEVSVDPQNNNAPQVTLAVTNTTSKTARFIAAQLTVLALKRGRAESSFSLNNGFSFPHNFYERSYIYHKDVTEQYGRIRLSHMTRYEALAFGEEYRVTVRLRLKSGDYYLWGGYGDFFGPISLMSNGIELSIPEKTEHAEIVDTNEICKPGEIVYAVKKKLKLVKVLFPWRTKENLERAKRYYPDGFPPVTTIAVSPDANQYAWGDQGGNLFLWREDQDQVVPIRDSTIRRPKEVKRNADQERSQKLTEFDMQHTRQHKRFPSEEETRAFRDQLEIDPNAVFSNPLLPPAQVAAIRFTANNEFCWLDSRKNVWQVVLLDGGIVSSTKINPQEVTCIPGAIANETLVTTDFIDDQYMLSRGRLHVGLSIYDMKTHSWNGPQIHTVLLDHKNTRIGLGCEDGTVRLFALPTK